MAERKHSDSMLSQPKAKQVSNHICLVLIYLNNKEQQFGYTLQEVHGRGTKRHRTDGGDEIFFGLESPEC